MTIVLGLGAAALFAASDLSSVRATRALGPTMALLLVVLLGLVPALAALQIARSVAAGPTSTEALCVALAAGVAYYGGQLALLQGVRTGQMAVVAPIATLEGAVAASLAAGLGERISLLVVGGIAVAVTGAALTAWEGGGGRATGAGWGVLSALLFGGASVLWGHAEALPATTTVAAAKVGGLLLLLPLAGAALQGLRHPAEPPPWRAVWLAAGLELLALVAATAALALGPISVASVCQSQYGSFGALLALALLHERLTTTQLLGVAATGIGVSLMALG